MYLIAGLGNPTRQYEHTRHNVGFDVIDALAEKYHISINEKKHKALLGKGVINGQKVILAKPQTYMNLSGESLVELVNYYKLDPESELIVIYLIDYLILYVYLQNILAPELTDRILLTSLPWYIGGITAYSLTSWICLEPTWKRKILNFFISCGIIRIFFLSNVPQAYDGFIWILLLFTGFTFILPWLSVTRFKAGKQD